MYIVYNNVKGEVIFSSYGEKPFIEFAKKIVEENGDKDYSVLGVSDAQEYIEDYCGNLDLLEQLFILDETEEVPTVHATMLSNGIVRLASRNGDNIHFDDWVKTMPHTQYKPVTFEEFMTLERAYYCNACTN